MARALKWSLLGLAALLLLLGAAFVLAQHWVGGDDFRARIEREATQALGVPLRLRSVEVNLWPSPAVALQGVELSVKPPITAGRVDLRPQWSALLRGEPKIASLRVKDAVLPQAGLDAVLAAAKAKSAGGPEPKPDREGMPPSWMPQSMVLDGLTWTSAKGASWTLEAKAEMGSDGLPEEVSATLLRGRLKDARLQLRRRSKGTLQEAAGWPAWDLELRLAGGSVKGQIAAKMPGVFAGAPPSSTPAGAIPLPGTKAASGKADTVTPWTLLGQFETHDIEVSALTAPERTLSGLLEASTRLQARGASAGALGDALETQTRFSVKGAVLHGIDLAQAVKTVGMSRGGQTALDTLAGQVNSHGAAIQMSNLVASSGMLSATGNVSISPARTLSGRVSVDMAAGVVGVPLQVGGTLDAPSVTLTRGAMIGAAVGTVLAPGIGTGAGASLGDKVGEGLKGLFGGKK